MPLVNDMQRLVERTIDHLGGLERFHKVINTELTDMTRRWELDVTNIGRILRSHLYVEYYLTEHIAKANPRLGDLSQARLTFAQKLSLLDTSHDRLRGLVSGLRQINAVRNRLAHRLEAMLTAEDVQIFLTHPLFSAMRIEGAKPSTPSVEPIDVLEKFAQFAAHLLANEFSEFAMAVGKAVDEDIAQRNS
ncbi:hypothetical protein VM99_17020 [Pseudomonas chlororaphis]|uniref:Uncharacterized protein n=1 Tax=Pseudomonas chlororaphis TaxID=587753 RepID=A0A0G3GJK1_9PSED|nr:hypothetical protein VM99_17020 [Pseudomonas chlororaphis]